MIVVAALIGAISLLYTTVGQAGGTAFITVMALTGFPVAEMRPTALFLNIIAAGYATWRLHRVAAVNWRALWKLTLPSMVTTFAGGLIVLRDSIYYFLTGLILLAAAVLMILKRRPERDHKGFGNQTAAFFVGGGAGLLSGLSGIGGGVFLVPQLVALGWASPKRAVTFSPPFILCNSIVGLAGALISGQRVAPGIPLYSLAALLGAVVGMAIGIRWISERVTRYLLAAILAFASVKLLLR